MFECVSGPFLNLIQGVSDLFHCRSKFSNVFKNNVLHAFAEADTGSGDRKFKAMFTSLLRLRLSPEYKQ